MSDVPRALAHASLRRVGDSAFKSVCPACRDGLLPMRRDDRCRLTNQDWCLACGQHVVYTDRVVCAEVVLDTRRECTCTGKCDGPEGLAPQWRCVLGKERP